MALFFRRKGIHDKLKHTQIVIPHLWLHFLQTCWLLRKKGTWIIGQCIDEKMYLYSCLLSKTGVSGILLPSVTSDLLHSMQSRGCSSLISGRHGAVLPKRYHHHATKGLWFLAPGLICWLWPSTCSLVCAWGELTLVFLLVLPFLAHSASSKHFKMIQSKSQVGTIVSCSRLCVIYCWNK